MVILRLLIQSGHYIDGPMSVAEANSIIDNWKSGYYSLKGHKYVSGAGWAVLLDSIVGMHIYTVQAKESGK